MSENKKFPLSVGDITEILANSGCRVSMVRPYTKIEMSTIDTPISIPNGELEVDISGGVSCFLSGMESIFRKCSTDHADAAKDQEIAELRQQRNDADMQAAISEVMAAMHEDESESLKKRLGKFTATVISAMRESIAEDAKKVIGKISEQAAIQDCIADEDGWIEWDGDVTRPWPVPLGTRIEYKLRDGYIDQRPCASMLIWRNDGAGSDIIAYRIPK